MYTNHNKTRKPANEYEKLGSQKGGYTAYDKGESGLLTTKNQTKAPTPPLRKNDNYPNDSLFGLGALAKNNLKSALQKLYPDNRYKGLFDGIEDRAVEKNLSLADDVISKNSANPYNRELFSKLPNLRGGLATYYAAAESGNHKAAKMARKLAYTETTEQPLPDIAKTAKTQTSNKRYVNTDLGLNLQSEPGTSKQIIGKLSKGDEVEFTGNKTGKIGNHEWAEIKYGDKTGWVAADYLNLEMPYDMYVPDRTDNSKSEMPQQEKYEPQTNNTGAGTRYVGEKTINMRAVPGLRSHTKEKIDYGQSVEYTGNNETLDGIKWAEVKYRNKTGWVIADYLKTQRSPDMPYKVDLTDHEGLRKRFAGVKSSLSNEVGDYDGVYGLQCVDLSKWFVDNFTTLRSANGNGKDQVNNLIEANKIKNHADKTIPCAPAIYSIAANKLGPGLSSMSSVTEYGHTGVILDVKRHYISEDPKKDKYTITYFHAWNGCNGYSSINTKDFYPSDDVTYLDLSNYIK